MSTIVSIGPRCHKCCIPNGATTELRTVGAGNSIGRHYWVCTSSECFVEWFDSSKSHATSTGSECKCGIPSTRRVTQTSGSLYFGLHYYACAAAGTAAGTTCSFFEWDPTEAARRKKTEADRDRGETSSITLCRKCKRKVTVKIVKSDAKGNRGRPFYKCEGCRKYEFTDGSSSRTKRGSRNPVLPGSTQYTASHSEIVAAQLLFDVPKDCVNHLPRSFHGDTAEVVGMWRVKNGETSKRFNAYRTRQVGSSANPNLRHDFATGVTALAKASGDILVTPNMPMLIHGTRPESLHAILYEGLKTSMCKTARFGCGTYFAENAGKILHYTGVDQKYQCHQRSSRSSSGSSSASSGAPRPLAKLHSKLYGRGVRHQKDVRYALICRVALGDFATTIDGETSSAAKSPSASSAAAADPSGSPKGLFLNAKKKDELAGGKHALVVQTGGAIKTPYREFVVFGDPAAIHIDYVVALKPKTTRCPSCSEVAFERTVTKLSPNYGRKILICKNGNCSTACTMLPLCFCRQSALVKIKRSDGGKYYACKSRRGCKYINWDAEDATPTESEIEAKAAAVQKAPRGKRVRGAAQACAAAAAGGAEPPDFGDLDWSTADLASVDKAIFAAPPTKRARVDAQGTHAAAAGTAASDMDDFDDFDWSCADLAGLC